MTQGASTSAKRSAPFLAVVTALAGLAVGFYVGRTTTPAPGSASAAASNPIGANTGSSPSQSPSSTSDGVSAAAPASPARVDAQRQLDALIERAPQSALQEALAIPNRAKRDLFVNALLRSWAEKAPAEALQWALAQPAGQREHSLASVISAAAARPDDAIFLVNQLCAAEPIHALERGSVLIQALTERGNFADAARFAIAVDSPNRAAWTGAAFARWAEWEPQEASRAALNMSDPAQRELALRAAVTTWAPNEPATLADFATKLPAGEMRTYALGEAMRQWIDADPVAASSWIERFEPSRELDQAVAAIAQQPYLAERRPDVALSWAESIVDRGVRASTLATLVQSWAQRDPAAARRYLDANRDLSDEERKDLIAVIGR